METSSATHLVLPEAGEPFSILNPCTDFGFKKVFSNPIILIDFLNHILDYNDGNRIVELSYTDKEFQSLDSLGRDFTVDIACRTLNDRFFIIEMQNNYTSDYADKAFVEFGRFLGKIDVVKINDMLTGDLDRKRRRIGETDVKAKDFWRKIQEVCIIVISNKRLCPHTLKEAYANESVAEPDVINTYRMRNVVHTNRHLGTLNAKVVLIMLANFHKTEGQLETATDRWLYSLKDENMASAKLKINPFKEISNIATAASDNEPLKQFYAVLHTKNIGLDILQKYKVQIQEANSLLDQSFVEGLEEGKHIGLEEGVKREKRATLLILQGQKCDTQTILQILRVNEQQLQELMTENDLIL